MDGTEPNVALNNCAPFPDDNISCTRENSSIQSSSSGSSIPLCEVRQTSIPSSRSRVPIAMRTAASPTERRDERIAFVMTFPATDKVGSIRIDFIVYSSRKTGYRRRPPINGDASGDDSGIPNNSPYLKVAKLADELSLVMAFVNVLGTSTLFPLKRDERNFLPSSSFFSSVFLFLDSSIEIAGIMATFIVPGFEHASFTATLTASIIILFDLANSDGSICVALTPGARAAFITASSTPSTAQMMLLAPAHQVEIALNAED
mmetsp:Transcript_5904/g.7526  ORF Transcript_5904/g.7526 Transcript_5904/m.7526 type:complete len:261 (-) Transcript_5904:545-1327(-)